MLEAFSENFFFDACASKVLQKGHFSILFSRAVGRKTHFFGE